jgi:hypothetical protein
LLLETGENLTEEDRELLMKLSPAYLRWREETLQEGRLEGRQQDRREMVVNLLRVRFGSLDDQLAGIVAPLLQLPAEDLTRFLLTLSREELLERFGGQSG